MFAIEVDSLFKIYNKGGAEHRALDGLNLQVRMGSFFGLLGRNGAGKSTFINILSSCSTITSGNIKVMGLDLSDKNNVYAIKQKLGIVPQEIVFDPFFTAEESLEFYAGYFGIPKAQRRTQEILDAMGLSEHKNKNVRMLSGGMKRRLLIGKALVQDPDIIVLDEPTAGVDIELRVRLWEYIKALNARGKTIILTTHYLEEAEELCDEIAIIDKGKVLHQSSKKELKKKFNKNKIMFKTSPDETKYEKINDLIKNLNVKYNRAIELSGDASKGEYDLKYVGNEEFLEEMMSGLSQRSINITHFKTEKSTLEEIFKEITAY